MKVIETRDRMIKIIREVGFGSKTYEQYVEELCDKLMSLGAFVPPAKVGDTVYAVLPSILGEEPYIEAWEVKGFGVDHEGDLFVENQYGEQYTVGTNYCLLTREAAEEKLEVYKKEFEIRNPLSQRSLTALPEGEPGGIRN